MEDKIALESLVMPWLKESRIALPRGADAALRCVAEPETDGAERTDKSFCEAMRRLSVLETGTCRTVTFPAASLLPLLLSTPSALLPPSRGAQGGGISRFGLDASAGGARAMFVTSRISLRFEVPLRWVAGRQSNTETAERGRAKQDLHEIETRSITDGHQVGQEG